MSVNFKEEKKKQKYLVILVSSVILVTVLILWFGVFKDKSNLMVFEIRPANLIKEIDVDFNALDNSIFDDLKVFEDIPEFEGEIGRENPFLPY